MNQHNIDRILGKKERPDQHNVARDGGPLAHVSLLASRRSPMPIHAHGHVNGNGAWKRAGAMTDLSARATTNIYYTLNGYMLIGCLLFYYYDVDVYYYDVFYKFIYIIPLFNEENLIVRVAKTLQEIFCKRKLLEIIK